MCLVLMLNHETLKKNCKYTKIYKKTRANSSGFFDYGIQEGPPLSNALERGRGVRLFRSQQMVPAGGGIVIRVFGFNA